MPGVRLALAFTLFWLAAIVVVPVGGLLAQASAVPPERALAILLAPRTLAAFRLSFGSAVLAAAIDVPLGLLLAWSLTRYRFPGRALLEAMVDLPFALPTSVAGIALAALYADDGWIGAWLARLGWHPAFSPAGVVIALAFVGLPFLVRTVQPVLADIARAEEEAALTLGAPPCAILRRVVLPPLLPAIGTGFALALARGVGEYGSVIFIAGNRPGWSEIVPLLIVVKLEQFDMAAAALLGAAMLGLSFVLLLAIHLLQRQGEARLATDEGAIPAERAIGEGRGARLAVLGATCAVALVMLGLPLAVVFSQAFSQGGAALAAALTDPDALAAIRLTVEIALLAVPLNTVFGLAAAWCGARGRFPGRQLLAALTELPFSVSPVVAGLLFVLLFGLQGSFGPWLQAHGIAIIFALPGMVLATVFVTLPFVARQVAPLLQAQSRDEEEAARTLGANFWQMLWHVTLPRIRWALLSGVLLCTARAIGEFGAVSVVSGHIRGVTNTMPLHIEILYDQYELPAAFGMAALLATMALATIFLRMALEWRHRLQLARGRAAVGGQSA